MFNAQSPLLGTVQHYLHICVEVSLPWSLYSAANAMSKVNLPECPAYGHSCSVLFDIALDVAPLNSAELLIYHLNDVSSF